MHIIMPAHVCLINSIVICSSIWTQAVLISLFFLLTAGRRTRERNSGVQRENRILPCKNAGTCECFSCFILLSVPYWNPTMFNLCSIHYLFLLVYFLDKQVICLIVYCILIYWLSQKPYRCTDIASNCEIYFERQVVYHYDLLHLWKGSCQELSPFKVLRMQNTLGCCYCKYHRFINKTNNFLLWPTEYN